MTDTAGVLPNKALKLKYLEDHRVGEGNNYVMGNVSHIFSLSVKKQKIRYFSEKANRRKAKHLQKYNIYWVMNLIEALFYRIYS